jgi:hypothetical protein
MFDRRALNRITHCLLGSKSIVGQTVCRGKSLSGLERPAPASGGDSKRRQRDEQVLYKSG